MPPPPGRKTPFSGKAKKEQLKAKKGRKLVGDERKHASNNILLRRRRKGSDSDDDGASGEDGLAGLAKSIKLGKAHASGRDVREPNRYALQFYKETKEELMARKEFARHTLTPVADTDKEIDCVDYFPSSMDIPKRPPWNFKMSRQELEAKEHQYFTKYVADMEKEYGVKNLSYFELNLETWRQLWRVLELSDIVLIIVDARTPALMFPPSVYKFITEELQKSMILVLNKIDLVPAHIVLAWKHYFSEKFPTLRIITFTSFPSYNLRGNPTENKTGLQVRRRKGRQKMAAEGALKLYEACNDIVSGQVDLASWHQKILEEMNVDDEDDGPVEKKIVEAAPDTGYEDHVRFKDGILTVGCIGQPNVGKSSLMNAIMGRKVVSVSRTPGHTKHFQTIFLTEKVRLCDCPGLVFPSTTPRSLQILIGSYPIAQVREPFTAIKFLAERLDLVKLLGIQHPEDDDTWSAIDICDGWAKKRGFYTAKAARLDSNRAANNILRMALDGKLCLTLKPPKFHAREDEWKNHPEVAEITWIQAKKAELDKVEYEGAGNEEDDELDEDLEEDEDDYLSGSGDSAGDADQSAGTETRARGDAGNKFALLSEHME